MRTYWLPYNDLTKAFWPQVILVWLFQTWTALGWQLTGNGARNFVLGSGIRKRFWPNNPRKLLFSPIEPMQFKMPLCFVLSWLVWGLLKAFAFLTCRIWCSRSQHWWRSVDWMQVKRKPTVPALRLRSYAHLSKGGLKDKRSRRTRFWQIHNSFFIQVINYVWFFNMYMIWFELKSRGCMITFLDFPDLMYGGEFHIHPKCWIVWSVCPARMWAFMSLSCWWTLNSRTQAGAGKNGYVDIF